MKTKRTLLALALVATAVLGWAPPGRAEAEKPRIAVLEFTRLGVGEVSGAILVDRLRSDLVGTGRFTVLDRAQSDKIVEELARQQSGLTDAKTAVQIGQQFNVQRVVTGRVAAQNSLGIIQVNAEMIDMKTAVILRSETITHEGDLHGFLVNRVPALAAALAGVEAPPGAPPRAAALAPPPGGAQATGEKKKVALFPALFQGDRASRLENAHASVLGGLGRVFEKIADRAVLAHSFYAMPQAADAETMRREFGDMGEAWSGVFKKTPDEKFVFRAAKKLGVNLVLMYQSRADRGLSPSFTVYLLDADTLRTFERSGSWPSERGAWRKAVAAAFGDVLREYKRENQR